MELRQAASESDRDQTFEIMRRAFNAPRERRERWDTASANHLLWGLYEGTDLLASAKVLDWGQHLGGRRVPMAAISGVGVAPQHRGRGHASELFRRLLPSFRERGVPLSGLMPASTALYRKSGYELASSWYQVTMPTRALHGLPRVTHVPVRVATTGDLATIVDLERRLLQEDHGSIDVAQEWWDTFAAHGFDEGFAYLADDGYTWYRQGDDPKWGYSIEVLAMVAASVDTLCALWHAIGSSSTMARSVTLTAPMDAPLRLLLPEQEMVTSKELEYMLRVCDLPAAVEARGYPAGLRASASITVHDPIVSENDGAWRIVVEDGKGRAERTSAADATMTINGFASLYAGWSSPALLRSTGLLRGGSADDLAALGAMFSSTRPVVQQFF
jgi:predicted acetyltransferase